MKIKSFLALVFVPALISTQTIHAQQAARVETFSPQGIVKNIRQVRAKFSQSMMPFGEPREAIAPFDIDCPEKGTARWADDRNWIYDFARDLPAGVRCEFKIRQGLKTLSGIPVSDGRLFEFSTGGPSILSSDPYEGAQSVNEDQIFILQLDAQPTEASVLSNVYFTVEGIAERVGVQIVTGEERDQILKTRYRFRQRGKFPPPILLLQAKQRFPNQTKISLVWGKGVATISAVATTEDQVLPFVTRPEFSAIFRCQRENPQADCVPISPMSLSFTAPIRLNVAAQAVLKGPDGRVWHATAHTSPDDKENYVQEVSFNGPFPEKTPFQIEIPIGILDDAGRKLSNADRFPLQVQTDQYPPLAKFAANFGILELNADPHLPITVRNIEPQIAAQEFQVAEGETSITHAEILNKNQYLTEKMRGMIYKVPSDRPTQAKYWIDKIEQRSWEDRDKSIFTADHLARAKSFTLPKLQGAKSFEVIGIPLPSPGFYVVEIKSEILGAALLGATKPMYVPTTVLVTNLSVHFKWGIESSLVWVTTLDKAKPVKDSEVEIRDCQGNEVWRGRTDQNGMARIQNLPGVDEVPQCSYQRLDSGLLVSAQLGEDMAFLHTSWNEGIEPWRFQVSTEYDRSLVVAHTIFDRPLLRAGETVHMKHILRRHGVRGFAFLPVAKQPQKVLIQHLGSQQKYEFPVRWDSNGIAETTWTIPKEAKLGEYQVSFTIQGSPYMNQRVSGQFRVEEFRVPLMKANLRYPSEALVASSDVTVDLMVSYLSGGAGSLPVKFRHNIQPGTLPSFEEFEDFVFATGAVKEGVFRSGEEEAEEERKPFELKSTDLTLDKSGAVRTTISGLPKPDKPVTIATELEFRDPNGEIQTVASSIPLWPSSWLVGLKPDSWALSKDSLKFQMAVTDLHGKPVSDAAVKADLFQRKYYSHRKRLVGGFYAYENYREVKRIQTICPGKTDNRGLLLCQTTSPLSGNVILQASTVDPSGHESVTNRDVWVAGKGEWWFSAHDDDRIDLLPEKKRYEPGDMAKFQVRMPFREATALVTVEREGVGDAFIKELSGREPVIEIPVKGNYAPNIFVSVLVIRGRVNDVQPTATVDLGRPAYKLGIAEIKVGWKAHELKVAVSTDRSVYKVREKAKVSIAVKTADGKIPPLGSEVAVAAVDEGLLQLMPNPSWQLLAAMMGRRGYGVQTSTAQTHVIGKRHFGLKALPTGGGGGKQMTRELFDTLLFWKGRVLLDPKGEAEVEVPLNDSLTSFRIVAVATSGAGLFGAGSTSIRSTQDLSILSGIPPLVREGDRFRSEFSLRNSTEHPLQVRVSVQVRGVREALKPAELSLAPGESKTIGWNLTAPVGVESLKYELEAKASDGSNDHLATAQKVVPAIPVRTFQATLLQIDKEFRLEVERPKDAVPRRGGIHVSFQPKLVDAIMGVTEYMKEYPYICLEQEASRAVALRDENAWNKVMAILPTFLDSDGLAKYFPGSLYGSDTLTSYLISIAHEAGWKIPENSQTRMIAGIRGFVEGRVVRSSSLPTADLSIRKLAAVESLSRWGQAEPQLLSSITLEPNLWPTSAIIDWFNILQRMANIPKRDDQLQEAEQILNSRLNFQGTVMSFSTERSDFLWWLMVSNDSNAVRAVLSLMNSPSWKEDLPRLIRGALGRQKRGHWDTTVANAWGVLAMEKFSRAFENVPVTGASLAKLGGHTQSVDWGAAPKGKTLKFEWPLGRSELSISPATTGKPWATIQSLAAIPLKEPFSTGYRLKKTYTPIDQKVKGAWSQGDLVRVRLELEAQSDMTWVVVGDPIPAGSSILGTGLGRDSMMATRGEERKGWVWPAFEERSLQAFRAYYEYVPKGQWTVEYTIRLNNGGVFNLPPTRIEAMYSPEMFGEIPNEIFRVENAMR